MGQFRVEHDYHTAWRTFWKCEYCNKAIVADLAYRDSQYQRANVLPHTLTGPIREYFHILATQPEARSARTPEHVPDRIRDTYAEAVSNLESQRWTSAGIMFRKTLEMTTLTLGPNDSDFRRQPLYGRIETLATTGELPSSMRELAHEIRVGGNVAAHEETYSEEEALEIKAFCELFLIYLFTLPTRIATARERRTAS